MKIKHFLLNSQPDSYVHLAIILLYGKYKQKNEDVAIVLMNNEYQELDKQSHQDKDSDGLMIKDDIKR